MGEIPVWAGPEDIWAAFAEARREAHALAPDSYTTFSFGDDPATADSLAQLVVSGAKTATSSLLWEDEEAIARPGDLAVVLDGSGRPMCVIETLDVRVVAFDAVTPEMAAAEGEGDRTLDSWRREHWAFFGRVCAEIGREPSGAMPVVWERFRHVFPRQASQT